MNNDLFDRRGHIKNSSIEKLKNGNLKKTEINILSEHIESCEECAQKLSNSFEQKDFLKVPCGFEEEIEYKINRNHKKNKQLFFYSLKVSAAACMALVLVFSSALNFMADTGVRKLEIKSPQFTAVNSMNVKLENFTNNIIDREVFNNGIQKK
ncbi:MULTISPECIES: hypothetical protein [Clostridium]|uniref:Zf-HC2 domain-containing protein n=1 Tax=Clostridium lapidicellarium TaxID=3240931 RepID=A0ABV4DWK1_9CLOT|nr:hypothetical protein [uncultured Clostridium sp.]